MLKQIRKNPLWFNLIAFVVLVTQITGLFYVDHAQIRSVSQAAMTILCCAIGVKDRKMNKVMSNIFFILAVFFLYISMQTLWVNYLKTN